MRHSPDSNPSAPARKPATRGRWAVLIPVALLVMAAMNAAAHAEDTARVLVLHAYHSGFDWTDHIHAGIVAAFENSKPPVNLFVEYLDSKRHPKNVVFPLAKAAIEKKYAGTPFDLIITSDDNALDFVLQYRSDLFAGIPVVFCGVNQYQPQRIAGQTDITGIAEDFDLARNVELIRQLQPGVKRIAVVSDVTPSGAFNMQRMRKVMPRFADTIEFVELYRLTADELTRRLKNLPAGSAVLNLSFWRDPTGKAFNHDQSIRMIVDASPVPVYTPWGHMIQHGTVGGWATNGRLQGRLAARYGLRILAGEPAGTIAVRRDSPNTPIFDYTALKRYGIRTNSLPAGSILQNEPDSFYYHHRLLSWLAILFIVLETAVIATMILNISRRRKAETALGITQQRYREIAVNIPGAVYQFERTSPGRYRMPFVSEGIEPLIGLSAQTAMNDFDRVMNKIHQNDIERMLASIEQSAEAMSRWTLDFRIHDPEGNIRWIRGSSIPHQEEAGRIIWNGVLLDITGEKISQQALRRHEEEHRAVLEATADPVIAYDTNGLTRYVNPAFTRVFGWQAREVLGRRIDFVPEANRPETMAAIATVYNDPKGIITFETRRACKDGRIIDVSISAAIHRTPEGQPAGMVVNITDITGVRRLESQLQQAQKMESIGTLAGGIAHDFNNILSAVIGYSELSLTAVGVDHPVHSNLKKILEAGNRARDLVQQILTFSRQDRQEPVPVKPAAIVNEALKLLTATLPTNIRIEHRPDKDAVIMADPIQLHQIVMNLCTNAAHAMAPDGGKLTIASTVEALQRDFTDGHPGMRPGNFLHLTIADTGCGIEPAVADRIFDPFFTTKEKGKGTGMGLSVVHGIIRHHNGAITVDSQPGQGTTFHLYLPVVEPSATPDADPTPVLPTGTESILFVDDDPFQAEIAQQMLERLGYRLTVMTDGLAALEKFKAAPDRFDLIMTDLDMPAISGDRVAQQAVAIRPDVPIILCTGFSDRITDENARQYGIRAMAMKPYIFNEIAVLIRNVLTDDNPGSPPATDTSLPAAFHEN